MRCKHMAITIASTICHMYLLCVSRSNIYIDNITIIYVVLIIDTQDNNNEPQFTTCYFPIHIDLNSHNIIKVLKL